MPMDMRIALVAPEAQDIETLSREDFAHGGPDSVNERLKPQITGFVEVRHHPFAVLERCY